MEKEEVEGRRKNRWRVGEGGREGGKEGERDKQGNLQLSQANEMVH